MQLASKPTVTPESKPTEQIILDVGGMKCAGCVGAVERQLLQQQGVIAARVNLATEVATVECEENAVDGETLAKALTEGGFPTQARYSSTGERNFSLSLTQRHQQEINLQIRRIITCAVLLVLSSFGHLHHLGFPHIPFVSNIWFHWGLATLALLFPGRSIIIDGAKSLFRNAPNMNTLVGLGTVTAYTTSLVALLFPQLGWECFFDEPMMLLGFILLGKTLEQHARHRATNAFQGLIALQPTTARLVPQPQADQPLTNTDNQSVEIPATQVRVGEWLQVLPGEKIPVDGEIYRGKTTVNESMLTGESMPVTKQPGDSVAAGTINESGMIILRATRTGEETTLAQIVALVENAQTRKAPIQKLADTVAGYFTYGVMSLAALTFGFWFLIGTHLWPNVTMLGGVGVATDAPLLLSLKLAIAVLVIACPCALGLATPTAIVVGSSLGAERGLLIKGGDILERVHHLNTVVFDKTGTLTTGKATVTDIHDITSSPLGTVLQLAATVEQGSSHPLGKAICLEAKNQGILLLNAEDFQTEAGLGVSANVNNQRVWVGNLAWLLQNGVNIPQNLPAFKGKTAIYVAVGDEVIGILGMSDPLKPDAKTMIKQLIKMGLRVMVLTGDRQDVAEAIAQQLDLKSEDLLAEVRPSQKASAIAQLQQQGQQVAMVGDGINDAPALAQADVGIGLHTGTDVANETADIILMGDSLFDVGEAIKLSRATFNKIRQNLFWALIYNLLGIPIAAGLLLPSFGIVLSPATAGAFMAFSSVSVVTNSLLLRRQVKVNLN